MISWTPAAHALTLPIRRISSLAILFAAYFIAAKLGLSFASVHPSATAIWPPTGIAIAGFLLYGRQVWPAIFAAAFLANVTTAGSIVTSIAIAAGNTLEGIVGASLARRFAHGSHAFERPTDIFRFVALTGLVSTSISPTVGTTTLALAGYAQWSGYGLIWLTWWLGDIAGALLVTPLILLWNNNPDVRWQRSQWLEGALLLVGLAVSTVAVFGGLYAPTRNYPIAFLCIPALVWTAFRFGQRETATAILIVLGVATEGTLRGVGPFADAAPFARLLIMQAFMATVAPMVLSIAALVAEQMRLLASAEKARAEAEAANASKDAFLAMLGHELRNPLAAITTAVHVLDRVATLEGKAARVREIIVSQVAQLTRLVDDLLDVTRVTTGKIVLRPERLELAALVSKTVETLTATGRTEGHAVTFNGEPSWVDGDATRLEQVVTNLVTNAVKYTPSGGAIGVTVGRQDRVATIRVEDTGIGIAPDLLPRIFDLFTQGLRGLDRSQGGLGIGLTIVKRLVELHGGRVEATSHPGRGTVFTIRLPGVPPPQTAALPAKLVSLQRGRRVLVVEDQPHVRETLCLALNAFGHLTFEASDGLQAIEVASQSDPEVAVIDIGLPGWDGYEVARQLRRTSRGGAMYLIALTGYGQPEDQRLAEAAGFDLHIVKPVDPERLSALVADASRATA